MKTNAMMAIIMITTAAIPTPIPAFAAVLRPSEEGLEAASVDTGIELVIEAEVEVVSEVGVLVAALDIDCVETASPA